jgi:hypothetical protein
VHTLYAIAAALCVGPETLLPALPDVSPTFRELLGEPLHPDELDWVQRVVKPRRE